MGLRTQLRQLMGSAEPIKPIPATPLNGGDLGTNKNCSTSTFPHNCSIDFDHLYQFEFESSIRDFNWGFGAFLRNGNHCH